MAARFVSVTYASLVASRDLLKILLACLNFTLDVEDLLGTDEKKKVSMRYDIAQAAENHGDEWDLV